MKSSKALLNIVMSGIWACLLVLYFTDSTFKKRLTSLVFGEFRDPTVQAMPKDQYRALKEQQKGPVFEHTDAPMVAGLEQTSVTASEYPAKAIFRYVDDAGVVVMVDDIEKVPKKYRLKMIVTEGGLVQKTTPIEVVNNQAYVTAALIYQGRMVTAKLLLDTGASGIVISPELAQRLGAQPTSQSFSILADGRRVPTYGFRCDSVSVGAKSQTGTVVSIIPGKEGENGLLGMSFLGEFPHTIDLKARVIRWL